MQLTAAAAAVSFDALVKHPQAYHHRRVTLVGVAIGNGPTIELHRDLKSAEKAAAGGPASESVLARAPLPWDARRRHHMRLVRITGIVDAHHHGFWGNPCEMSIEKIEALTDEPLGHWKIPVAVLHNATSSGYRIYAGSAGVQAKLSIAPEGILQLPRPDGTLTVFDAPERVLARTTLDMNAHSRYLDRKEGAFYYEIRRGTIIQVMPQVAKGWGWRR